MARKKGKKKKISRARVAAERLEELRSALDGDQLTELNDDEAIALADALVRDQAVAALVRLRDLANGKAQRKAINQGLYRLKQRGVDVPDLSQRSSGIDLTKGLGGNPEDLPVLLHEPFGSGARLFLLPHQSGRRLQILQVQFQHPLGLNKLVAGDVGRAQYRQTIRQITKSVVIEGATTAVEADDALRQRKLWEIGYWVHQSKTGPDVDHAVVAELRWPAEPPPHPALDLDLADVTATTTAELERSPRFLVPLLDQSLLDRVQSAVDASGESPLLLSEQAERERLLEVQSKAIGAWVDEWDATGLTELLLDAALFHGTGGRPDVAKAFLHLVEPSDPTQRRQRIVDWLADVLAHMASGEPEPIDDESSRGGIITP